MSTSLFMHRLWPRLLRALNSGPSLARIVTRRSQQGFAPMAILLDETQAYKPASHSNVQAALPN
ncbi:MAG: hypothetical protein Q4A28_01555 [Brachymonas sp.]|nr:hypothetical protein [Brachymonas sp.]